MRTTPEAIDLQRTFRAMLDAGDAACVMEVSSHALELHRADAIEFDCAVFTNLTQDHLDFHGTLEDYFAAKRRLFVPHGERAAARAGRERRRRVGRAARRGARPRRATPSPSPSRSSGTPTTRAATCARARRARRFACAADGDAVEVTLPLPGLFNVYNALGAIAAARRARRRARRTPPRRSRRRRACPGRFEPVDEGQGFSVLVDYAHTPDSLENVLRRRARAARAGRAAGG